MFTKRVLTKFFDRKLKDYRTWKDLTDRQIQDKHDRLPIKPPIWKKLRRDQKICFLIGAETSRFFIMSDPGCGKTLISIALILYFAKLRKNRRVLVLVPRRITKSEWAREIRKHSDIDYDVLPSSSEGKWACLESTKALIVVETYQGLMSLLCDKVPSKKKAGKNKWKPSEKLIKRLMQNIDGLIMDEVTEAKHRAKLPFRICRQISKRVGMVYALSGTPFGRNPEDLWAQMFLVDEGETLGPTLGLFREAFFTKSENGFGGFDYKIDKTKMGKLNRMLANRSIRYTADSCDLPKVVPIVKYVPLSHDAEAYYDSTWKKLVALKRGNVEEMRNEFLRLRQISSGFLGYHDDELGIKAQIEFNGNPKLDLLLSIIETIPKEYKVLVFHDFIFSGSIISRELEFAGVKHVRLTHKTKNTDQLLKQFDEDDATQIFVLNTAGAFGLNLQRAKYGIYFESPVSVILRQQMTRRFERQYSLHKNIFLYDLIIRNTVDEDILEFHKTGRDLFQAIIEGKRPR